ncbi:MAG TPA: cisplatin damage response ATP-dependent DNA ligase [Phenylobacterium sp.]|jgi:DNA ligase-1|nr:cisplatin damage response ATP-dependent DNA ligase [Phenylobacterium sp.]
MRAFAELLDRLSLTASRNAKLTLVRDYLAQTPDPDRGWALAALTGDLTFKAAKPTFIRKAVEARMDPQLFWWSYDYVGDLAETVALVWPRRPGANREPELSEVVEGLRTATRAEVQPLIEGWLDAMDAPRERWALLKLMTRELRVGLTARLAKRAAAELGGVEPAEIEELWHALHPPYEDLFAWLEHRSEKPSADHPGRFRPAMLAQAIDEAVDFARLDPADYAAEWKWDGVRVQLVNEAGVRRLYTRTGDDISRTFPDVVDALFEDGVVDGELLVLKAGPAGLRAASFADLQQRLNRKAVDARLMARFPAGVRAYDLLAEGRDDTRTLPFAERRKRLEAFVARQASPRIDLSPLQPFETWPELARLRADPPAGDPQVAEGIMLKRWDSIYEAGRPKGPWFKWKRDPYLIDAVLMYAQRGHGKRSSFYSDYTFGVWTEGEDGGRALTPVGKAYFGFTDEELKAIDKFVRDNTVERFGPVRSVRAEPHAGLVFEVAFEGLQRSGRHRSGVAMRFPRISRIRWDKPPGEADELATLERMLAQLEGR